LGIISWKSSFYEIDRLIEECIADINSIKA
jgi:hypothetical protein